MKRSRLSWGVLLVAGMLLTSCLGQDYLDAPLGLESYDHGWLVNVEPDEEFGAHFFENPLYPEGEWRLADHDPSVVRLVEVDSALEDRQVWEYSLAGVALGRSPLVFELVANGTAVDRCEFFVAVVDDACEPDLGFAANRCRQGKDQPNWAEFNAMEHGMTATVEPETSFEVGLFALPGYPSAAWQIAELDRSVADLVSTEADPARTPGDWDTTDRDKPWFFLEFQRLTFEARALGTTPLVLEVVDDGVRVALYEQVVEVVEDASP